MSHHTRLDLSEHLPYLINRVGSALVARFSADGLAGARLSIASWRVPALLESANIGEGELEPVFVPDGHAIVRGVEPTRAGILTPPILPSWKH